MYPRQNQALYSGNATLNEFRDFDMVRTQQMFKDF